MKIFSKKNLSNIFDTLLIIIGAFLMGFSFNVFLNNNKISPSGFSGLSAIISNLLAMHLNVRIPPSVFYLIINAVLFAIAFKNIGLKFAINSVIGVLAYSLFMEFCKFDIGLDSSDLLLCAVFGGVIMGIGLGLIFRGKASTGGTDMLANILVRKFKFLTTGNIIFIVDFIVVVLSYFAYGQLRYALYSLVAIWVLTKVSDIIVSGFQSLRAYYIISPKSQEIATKIMQEIERGVTGFKSQGMYTHSEQNVLMTVVTKEDSIKLRQIVSLEDKNAFMFSCPISEVMGGGFMPLEEEKEKPKPKRKAKTKKEQE